MNKMDMEWLGKKNYEDFDLTIFSRKTVDMFNRGQQWKDDYAMDEAGTFSKILKHGILSQDAVWNMLERNKELARRIRLSEVQGHDNDENTHL